MHIVYLESSLDDIEWMRFYYSKIFDDENNVRELIINKTPFSFLYRINEDRIEILRLWDQRGNRNKLSPPALSNF